MATLEKLRAKLAMYEAAEEAILDGAQSYSVNGRALTRANLSDIREAIDVLEARIEMKEGSAGGMTSPLFLTRY